MKLRVTPALTIIPLLYLATPSRLLLGGTYSSVSSSAPSPYIETNPPNGIALRVHIVSCFLLLFDDINTGPNPIE